MSAPLVEVLTFEGCPHADPALELVRRVLAESGIGATVRRVDVPADFCDEAVTRPGPVRDRFKAWVDQLWREKDALLDELTSR